MDKFKNVKAWIGDDGYIHLNIVLSGMLEDGRETEYEIYDAALPLGYSECTLTRAQETLFCDCVLEEYFYLELSGNQLYLNPGANGYLYTTRIFPRKMTKAQIEKELGCAIEIIPDESERSKNNAEN